MLWSLVTDVRRMQVVDPVGCNVIGPASSACPP